ncbi:GOLPH3/VPS74 family protein [Actinocorallia longicatena]|uniref:GPP34 family phosphoprotein n=1 Tax=Actinocorallia longicatena TaxID=111803 RepID=A0ABP6Q8R9_9ACTN
MNLPDTLPQRLYLLAYDPDKGRTRTGSLGELVRAAALTDLYLNGHLADERGRPVVEVRHPCHDPVLEALLAEVAEARRPRKWKAWIGRRGKPAHRAVREQLAEGGWVRVETGRVLLFFPRTKVTLRDPRVRKHLASRVSRALSDPVGRVDPADAALVALSAAAELKHVLDRRRRRDNKARIADLTRLAGPAAPALRQVISEQASSAAG